MPPKLVYCTGSSAQPFIMPKDPDTYPLPKEACKIYGNKLNLIWGIVRPKVCNLLNALKPAWTTVNGVCFQTNTTNNSKPTLSPVVIWISYQRNLLEAKQAFNMANDILNILQEFNIDNVEVELQESLYHHLVSPALLKSVPSQAITVDMHRPLTTAIRLSISAADWPNFQMRRYEKIKMPF
ncbi:hypothetical protein RSOL_138110, partial [Rhizoctonia solani AG-3 Rhs1AP]